MEFRPSDGLLGDDAVPLPLLSWPYRSIENCHFYNNLTSTLSALEQNILLHGNLDLAISAITHPTTALDAYHLQGHPSSSGVNLVEFRNCAQHLTPNLCQASCHHTKEAAAL